jgi:uncharacterized protein (TIGR03382 family)
MKVVAALVGLASLLAAPFAQAVCALREPCLCPSQPLSSPVTSLEASVTAVNATTDGGWTRYVVELVRGADAGQPVGSTFQVGFNAQAPVGSRWLFLEGGDQGLLLSLSDAGVTCSDTLPPLTLSAQQAHDAFGSTDCVAALEQVGYPRRPPPQPCRDVRGCSTGPTSMLLGLASLCVFSILSRRRRTARRSSPASPS